jgi:hypothetical protein
MLKKLSLKQRVHAGFILAIAFLLVLASNRLNRRNFSTVEHTVNSVFEDRVVAQEYIYRLNNLFHGKEMDLVQTAPTEIDLPANERILQLLSDFEKTELTREESVHFDFLKENYTELQTLETDIVVGPEAHLKESKQEMAALLKEIGVHLDRLSEVQLTESRQLTFHSKKLLNMNLLLSRLEIAFLIVIGVLFLIIIFHREKTYIMLAEEEA